jgi:prevent-host-death family protein
MNIREAKTHFSRLVVEVQGGKEVVITRSGKPVAKLVPYDGAVDSRRSPGGWEGRAWISPDFDEVQAEVIDAVEGA